ncbi:cytochrome b [Hydrogenophaga sp. RWCD_12]|uniref:cytochrome b n=1 Tax=Hydrogenophaga sp. RWCD_12 TaxID=3391190 RepID=UPI003984DB0F
MNASIHPVPVIPPTWRYSPPAILIHWVQALLLAVLAGLGWFMMSIEDEPGSDWYFGMHKSLGLLFIGLVVIRLLWRMTQLASPTDDGFPAWQNLLSKGTQVLMYLLMFLMPLSGMAGAAFSEEGIAFFGIALPRWVAENHDTAEQFFDLHGAIVWALIALIALHVAGALKHRFIDRDNVFQRMWFKG